MQKVCCNSRDWSLQDCKTLPNKIKAISDIKSLLHIMSCVYCNLRHRWLRGLTRKPFLFFFAGDGPLEWVRPIPKAPERSWHASGPSFRPNCRFSTHFGPNLMFLDRTGTLVNQDWTWAEAWADLGLRPTLDDLGLRLGPILDQPWADFGPTLGRPWANFWAAEHAGP